MTKHPHFLRFPTLLAIALTAALTASSTIADDAKEEAAKFVRLRRGPDKEPLALETAIARFVSGDRRYPGARVDLVSAIHIGDKQYYEELNRRFKGYDAVLYELVAREEANVPRAGSAPGSAVSGVQISLKAMLGLAFQLDHIDYAAKNMVHADMSPEEFAASMKNRNESWLGMFFRVMGRGFAEQAQDPLSKSDFRLLAALFAPDRSQRLKCLMAEQFAELDGDLDMFDGPEGSTLVTERNKKALAVLTRELGQGKKRFAIFYGAAHLADFQRRLENDFGMKPGQTEWVTAWSLVPPSKGPTVDKQKAVGRQ
jgi:hypothetical protein